MVRIEIHETGIAPLTIIICGHKDQGLQQALSFLLTNAIRVFHPCDGSIANWL
jgi:hypothetical protein